MRHVSVLVAGALTLAVAMPAAAQEFKPPPNLFGQKKPAPQPPAIDWNWRPPAVQTRAPRATVVCGMTLIPADPKVDPKIRVAPERGVTFTVRAIEPTTCRP